jgi:hypothetical protein
VDVDGDQRPILCFVIRLRIQQLIMQLPVEALTIPVLTWAGASRRMKAVRQPPRTPKAVVLQRHEVRRRTVPPMTSAAAITSRFLMMY